MYYSMMTQQIKINKYSHFEIKINEILAVKDES